MVGIHWRQVATTAQGYATPDWNGGALHVASQLQAVAVIAGHRTAALDLIATTDNSIATEVWVLQTKRIIQLPHRKTGIDNNSLLLYDRPNSFFWLIFSWENHQPLCGCWAM